MALLEELDAHLAADPRAPRRRRASALRTPFGYYRGLRDRPDLLEIVRDAGLRYVTSWGRNEENGNPTPWVQPFTYAEEGYPDILELPFQFWLDVVWFDQHGYDTGPAAASRRSRARSTTSPSTTSSTAPASTTGS